MRGNFMLRIRTDQLLDLIYQDKKIKKELERRLKEDQEKRERCFQIYQEQLKVVQKLEKEVQKDRKEIQANQDQISKLHSKISMLEIKIMMAERKLKQLQKSLASCRTDEEKETLLLQIAQEKELIQNYQKEQSQHRFYISIFENGIDFLQDHGKKHKEQLEDENRILQTRKKNVAEWDLAIENRTNQFYQNTFDYLNSDFKQLQDLVVRNLQQEKKMTKDEAKSTTNAVLLDSDKISLDPPGKVRRLTKDEKEKYQNVQEL